MSGPLICGDVRLSALRWLAIVVSVISLAAGCSSTSPGPVDGAGDQESLDADSPRTGRAFGGPRGGRVIGEPGPTTVIHGIGSLSSIPDTSSWPDDFPIVAEDVATLTALDCAPATPGCELEALASIAAGEIDIVSFATRGADSAAPDRLSEAAQLLNALDVRTIGYGDDSPAAVAAERFETNGLVVAFHAISLSTDLAIEATEQSAGIAGPNSLGLLLDAVAASEAANSVTVVAINWGTNEARAPGDDQVVVAQQLIDAGADMIIGNGSDFLQRLERIESVPVVFSLGDATSNSDIQIERDTAVFRAEIRSTGSATCLLPATASIDGPTLDDPDSTDCQ